MEKIMKYLAHSESLDDSGNIVIPEQTYENHVMGVYYRCKEILSIIKPYLKEETFQIVYCIVLQAALYHDLGKLGDDNQKVMRHEVNGKMVIHSDAGVTHLLNQKRTDCRLAACLVHAHHIGLDNYHYMNDNYRILKHIKDRSPWINFDGTVKEYTNQQLDELIQRHNQCVIEQLPSMDINLKEITSPIMRLALSILVEGDHYDTAKNYKNFVVKKDPELRSEERLALLDEVINNIQKNCEPTPRNKIKQEVYLACRNSELEDSIGICPSEVGTGKTTALKAYALNKNKRKIVYIAPFTSIISQTVEVYRQLALPEENPNVIVAEHHHQVEYKKENFWHKIFAKNWNSPIVTTTAVQFFETLAGGRTGRIRKFWELAGSVVIIDESHQCIPLKLWPITLRWIKFLEEEMGCNFIFSSGSMVRPWEIKRIKELSGVNYDIKSIIPQELAKRTLKQEKDRVKIEYRPEKLSLRIFCDWMDEFYGPKLIVCNTLLNAARIVAALRYRGYLVEHLSTCLSPADREVILERVKKRLKDNPNENWVLVATSCVEAGIDFSFRFGFRENAGMLSANQFPGRINRNNEYDDSIMYVFELDVNYQDKIFTSNSEFAEAANIFREFYKQGKIGPEWCHEAVSREVDGLGFGNFTMDDKTISIEEFMKMEEGLQMRTIADCYNVISADKFTAIVNEKILDDPNVSMTDVVRNSVQIYDTKREKCPVELIKGKDKLDGFYLWKGSYDPNLLGYMAHFV